MRVDISREAEDWRYTALAGAKEIETGVEDRAESSLLENIEDLYVLARYTIQEKCQLLPYRQVYAVPEWPLIILEVIEVVVAHWLRSLLG
jgi:hypothetical protein